MNWREIVIVGLLFIIIVLGIMLTNRDIYINFEQLPKNTLVYTSLDFDESRGEWEVRLATYWYFNTAIEADALYRRIKKGEFTDN